MSISSQEPRGSGLSTSLVSDFRAIMNALEQQRAADAAAAPARIDPPGAGYLPVEESGEPEVTSLAPADPAPPPVSAEAGPAAAAPEPAPPSPESARPIRVAPQRPVLPERSAPPKPLSEVRGMIAALGQVDGMIPARGTPEPASTARPHPAATSDIATPPRRRAFGAANAAGEGDSARRRRAASKDVITWQRLGVLAVFIGVVGGGLSLLQSVVGRDEATVAPEAIGNAAIASVAPTQALPMAMPAPEPVAVVAAKPAAENASSAIASAVAAPAAGVTPATPVTLLSADPPGTEPSGGFAPALPDSVSAFAAPEAPAPEAHVTLPKQAPLPPPAPTKQVAAVDPEATLPADAPPPAPRAAAAPEAAAPGAPFGGEPVGSATIRRPVTMRAAPKKGSAPIGNIPAGRTVELVACTSWCEVIADGKRGFVYKSFVGAAAATSGASDAAADGEPEAESDTP
ncbi:SH3 domain-containing protein [Ancylobacter sp. G4_0304]|uniref:SH3 domain-containing protein n=1 Tax=Ancylobacter sp. G4_0304 TaxID=3114289 RepID=UPI0039C6A413